MPALGATKVHVSSPLPLDAPQVGVRESLAALVLPETC